MGMQKQVVIWTLILAGLVLFLYLFNGILLPFVLGAALAYALDPLADWLEKLKFSRVWATVTILIFASAGFIVFVAIFVPVLVEQLVGLAERMPSYIKQLEVLAQKILPELSARLGVERTAELQAQISGLLSQSAGLLDDLLRSVLASSLTILNIFSILLITPVVAFYLLLDWDRMIARIDGLLPLAYAATIRQVVADMGIAVGGFVRGQGTVMLILGGFYAIALSLLGLNFGIAIGVTAGLFSFIPYVGVAVGFTLSVGVALVQFWPEWPWVAATAGVFLFGQFVEGNILQPKLVGGSIGVHPVWLMFALFAFGSLFGFVGLLLAVPLAAVIGVLARFSIQKYLESTLYSGTPKPPAKPKRSSAVKPRRKASPAPKKS